MATTTSVNTSCTPFLNAVCPVIENLKENTHFNLEDQTQVKNSKYSKAWSDLKSIDWPLGNTTLVKASLRSSYLNISRPPLDNLNGNCNESTTYISLPFHINEQFSKIVMEKEIAKQSDGSLHIGANVNPLIHDPFKLVHLNPSCLTNMIDLTNFHSRNRLDNHDQNDQNTKNPFNKMTNSFNKLLKITTTYTQSNSSYEKDTSNFNSLINYFNSDSSKSNSSFNLLNSHNNLASNSYIFDKLLNYDGDHYFNQISNTNTAKLLVSAHVNVVNIIPIDTNGNYINTLESPSDEEGMSKSIESPLLRFQFHRSVLITCLKTFTDNNDDPFILLGLNSGTILIINLSQLTIRIFDDLGLHSFKQETDLNGLISHSMTTAVISLDTVYHPNYEFLIVAGYANGEVLMIDPYDDSPVEQSAKYVKKVVGKDDYVTYFKKADLSPLISKPERKRSRSITSDKDLDQSPNYLIFHIKLSHKPITGISSTIRYNDIGNSLKSKNVPPNPMVIAFASDDGLVRLIDLVSTFQNNYGEYHNSLNNSIVTDIISNYFHDGITDVEFSPDNRFLFIAGKGDLIEVFKMTYYNVNGLLTKNINQSQTNLPGKRSRSGTVNSYNSGSGTIGTSGNNNNSIFLSPINTFDVSSRNGEDHNEPSQLLPPIVKEVKIVTRIKGHSNTVKKIEFIKNEQLNEPSPVYKLISCGYDGRVIAWEFDYKALPRVKSKPVKSKPKKEVTNPVKHHSGPVTRFPTLNQSLAIKPSNSQTLHTRNRSWNFHNDENPLGIGGINNSMNKMLGTAVPMINEPSSGKSNEEQMRIIYSIYKSLYELRLKRHYTRIFSEQNQNYSNHHKKFQSLIHPVVDDKLVPSIKIPLINIDMSFFIKDGKIEGVYLDLFNFWIFAKSGDVFKIDIN